jgi:FdhD protein
LRDLKQYALTRDAGWHCQVGEGSDLWQGLGHEHHVQPVSAIRSALLRLDREQALNELTRAVHAAAWADLDGTIRCVREDVGRHNALDKLIGAVCRAGTGPDSGFVLVTSRCSFELVEKAAAFGARTLVAISAPTALGVERARLLNITLIGIARRDSVTVFHGAERISYGSST